MPEREVAQTQFTHLKAKKPDPSEKPQVVAAPVKKAADTEEAAAKAKEDLKKAAQQTAEQLNRKERKKIERQKEMERRKTQDPKSATANEEQEVVKEEAETVVASANKATQDKGAH